MAANDVPEYLNELIPYRCPKCGHTRSFATLRELRQHLQAEHSFQMGFIKPRTRAQVFRGAHESSGSSNFARSLSSEEKISGTSSKYGSDPINKLYRNNDEYYNESKTFRETSPLLKSFKEETEVLEKELQQARHNEMRHKAQSMRSLNESYVNSDFKTSLGSLQKTPGLSRSDYPENFQTNFVEKTKTKTPLSRGQFGSSNDFKSTLDSLNSEVMKSRMNQWVTTDALYKSQDLLKEMETAAETKCQEQRKIIETLVQEMKAKDVMLQSRTKDQADLNVERQRLLYETESLVKQTDDYNTRLMQELNGRGKVLDGLNKELESLKAQTQQEIMTKDQDLQHATQKLSKLEWERERLIQETDRILKQADEDTGRLRRTLQAKEEELKNVNEILSQLRSQQQCMLEKTMTVYRSSEESRDIMKTAIQTKDSQLQHAMKQIENMSSLHKRLLEQSQILTDQADDNTSSMKRLLHAKEDQIRDLVQQLETLKREKRNLEDSTLSLAEKAESSMGVVESLRDMVKQKESDLKATQSELHSLKSYLKSAADKERVARQKLEVFIEELIQRAEIAESQLHTLKSQSTDSFNVKCEGNQDPLSDKADVSSERRSLPSRIEPFNSRKLTKVGKEKRDTFYGTRTKEPIQKDKKSSTNLFVTTADVHHANPKQNRNIKISNYEDDARMSNETIKAGRNKRTQLEESGGFVACEETVNCESDEDTFKLKPIPDFNEDIHDAKHINHSKKDPCYNTNDKSNDSDFPSQPHEWVDKVQKRYNRKRERKNYSKALANTAEKQNEDLQKSGKYCTNGNINTSSTSTDVSETHGQSESDNCYPKENMTKKRPSSKISKGMQVGAFLSTQEFGYTKDDSFKDLQTASSDENFVDSENKTDLHRYIPNKNYKSAQNMKRNDKRPVTIGKSNQKENNSKKSHLKSHRRKKRSLNREFDTRFPTTHKSMVNIAAGRMDLSEGEVVLQQGERQRRSRSLSPRVFGTITSHQTGEMVESSSDTSLYEEMPNEIEDADMKLGEEDMERTDGVFENIMDENGILWDEDDMATLPDVSDSEFDRVSPSGSEAIATKNTSTKVFPIHPGSTKTTESKVRLSTDDKAKLDADDFSVSSVENFLNENPNKCIGGSRSRQNIFTNQTVDRNALQKRLRQEEFKTEKLDKNSDEASTDSRSNKVRFKPIKSPLYSKTSTSEKDQTSGGKEVRKIMESSPKIDILGTSASGIQIQSNRSDSSDRLNGRPSENTLNKYQIKKMSQDNSKIFVTSELPGQKSYKSKTEESVVEWHCYKPLQKESFTDIIDRISSKCSPNQKPKLTEDENNPQLDLEEKIKSINNKYKIKRENIVHGKGLGNGLDMPNNKSSAERSVSSSKMNIFCARETERNQGITNARTVHGMSDINVSNTRSSSYTSLPSTLASRQQLPYAFFKSDDSPTRLSENCQLPIGYPYMPYFTSCPPFQQFQFHPEYFAPLPQGWNQQPPESESHLFHTQSHQKPPNSELQMPRTQQQQLQQQQQQEQDYEHISFETPHNETNKIVTHVESTCNKVYESKTSTKEDVCEEREIKKFEVGQDTNITKDSVCQAKSCSHDEKTPTLITESNNYHKELPLNEMTQSSRLKTAEALPQGHTNDISYTYQQLLAANDSDEHVSTLDNRPVKQEIFSNSEKIKTHHENSDSLKNNICYRDQKDAGKSCKGIVNNSLQNVTEEDQTTNISPAKSVPNAEVSHHVPGENCSKKVPKLKAHLGLFDDTDDDESGFSLVNNSNLFAEEIRDESSIEYDSNTQSYLDLPGNGTDTDIDTDTESVRREFYEKTQKIKELVDGSHNDFADVNRHKMSRNTTSSASSQG